MTKEHKTLKDLKHTFHYSYDFEKDYGLKELKEEAIKWVKWYLKQKAKHPENEHWVIIYHRLIQEFMNFFNISEEDLK